MYLCRWCQTYCPDELQKPIKRVSHHEHSEHKQIFIHLKFDIVLQTIIWITLYGKSSVHATSCKIEKQQQQFNVW